jgi:hypothetical protein
VHAPELSNSMMPSAACQEVNWRLGGVHDVASLYPSDGTENADVANDDVGILIFEPH